MLSLYTGDEPFASFARKYFAQHRKFGSGDRRQVSHLCYCFFRLGKAVPAMPPAERIMAGLFLCSNTPNQMLEEIRPEWNKLVELTVQEKWTAIDQSASLSQVFPGFAELSNGMEGEHFYSSFFVQPDLFLRIRPGKKAVVIHKLEQAGIAYQKINDDCLALPAATKADSVLIINKEVVVQDYNSQRVGEFLSLIKPELSGRQQRPAGRVWDCCAASGGKSIMAVDILGSIDLTVSDIRESILANLKKRFAAAGITGYTSKVINLASDTIQYPLFNSQCSLIIADVPCTGSGTWSRTPEQLYYFDSKKTGTYAGLQKKIVTAAITQLQKGGYFLYITCSVFKKENEEAVEFIKEKFHLQLVKMELLKGYNQKADTMFAALLRLPL
jgi:16S rRNA (cytosine967-C5)-methyltransferase